MKEQFRGMIALLTATIIWGSAFIAQSVGMDLIGPFTFQAIRCALAVVFLLLLTLLFDWKNGGIPHWIRQWKDPALWKAGCICGTALFVAASLQQIGLVSTDAGKAGFITAMYIVFVPFAGLLIGRRPKKSALISVVLAVIGLYLLSCMGASGLNKGDLFVFGGAIGFTIQITLIDLTCAKVDGLRLNCIQALVVSLLSVPFMLLTEEVSPELIFDCWLPISYAGILSMGVAYSLQIIGQKHVEPTAASLIMSLESVFAVLFGWLLLHETMSAWETAGCILVFCAVILAQLPERKKSISTQKELA